MTYAMLEEKLKSICNHLPLLTADKGFKRIEGLDLNLLELSEV